MNLFENLQLMNEEDKLVVKIQSGKNTATDGQGYYNIFPERDKSNLTNDLWNKLGVCKLDVTHFPSFAEAEEYIKSFADDNDVELTIES